MLRGVSDMPLGVLDSVTPQSGVVSWTILCGSAYSEPDSAHCSEGYLYARLSLRDGSAVIEFAKVDIGTGPTAACVRCGEVAERSLLASELIRAALAANAASWSGGTGPNVMFVGMEPFAHPELPGLVSAAVGAGYQRIGLRTDAGALSLPDNAEGVLSAGVRHIEMVLAGGDAASHDAFAGRPGLFDSAHRGVTEFRLVAREAHVPVAVTGHVPVCVHTMTSLPAVVAALADVGAVAVELAVSPRAAAESALPAWLGAAIDTGMVNGVWVSVSGLAPASVPRSPLHALAPSRAVGATL